MARYLDPELHEIVSAQNAEIERLGFELKSWKESYKTLLEETEQLRQMVRDAATALNEEERENERLYDAIFRHRERIWGEGKVEHPEDVTLYEALGNE